VSDTVHTIGHSTRAFEELVTILEAAGVRAVADVRRFPFSRRHPQHNGGELARTLSERGIRYEWLGEALGGRRSEVLPAERSPNRAWKVAAFRNYADAMATGAFDAGVNQLEKLARESPTAYLCAEKLWWKCHRRLLSDLLVARGWRVVHLLEVGRSAVHELSEWAKLDGGRLTYPALV
jgi:uncharacterized protein (DUF488 family)